MNMNQLIEGLEEAMSDQDRNKLDYLRKREKKGLLKPDQKAELRKLDRVAKSDANKAAGASWVGVPAKGGGASKGAAKSWGVDKDAPKRKQFADFFAARNASKPKRAEPKTLLGKLGRKLSDFALGR